MRHVIPAAFICILAGAPLLLSCGSEESTPETPPAETGVFEIVSNAMDFQAAESIPSGWTTIRYKNQSTDTHFVLFEKYPEGKTLEDGRREVVPVFQQAMDSIMVGRTDSGLAQFRQLPPWFSEVQFVGGTGLIAPGKTAETTMELEPGLYVLECYAKMPDGKFHSVMGMLKQLHVTTDTSGGSEPAASNEITISSESGLQIADTVFRPGEHRFRVSFANQQAHGNFVGHDVHLARLTGNASLQQLEEWMNWMHPSGLTSPAPEGIEFLGGTQELPEGRSAYFSARLTPGNYCLIAEVPEASKMGMLKTFRVSEQEN